MIELVFDFPDLADFPVPAPPGAPTGPLSFTRPTRVLAAHELSEVLPVLRAAERWALAGGWAAGFVAYEAAPAFDSALTVRTGAPGPLAWFGLFDRPAAIPRRSSGLGRLSELAPDLTQTAHAAGIRAVRSALGRGDAYQVNFTFRVEGLATGDPLALYQQLHAAQGARYGAFLRVDSRAILSASPELFFLRRGDRISTRPMKGTARRCGHPEQDRQAARRLARSAKDRAENVMIVDLLRSDLGRVARTGTVRVAQLCQVEPYPTVFQMTSSVEAQLRPSTALADVFAALFPCGSVTGAPKASAMHLIAEVEASPRGAYCGAVGLVAPGGDACFNVAIRTLDVDLENGRAVWGTGGGVTWGSTAAGEWSEALAKAAVLSACTQGTGSRLSPPPAGASPRARPAPSPGRPPGRPGRSGSAAAR